MSRPVIGISTYLEPSRSGVWNTMASFLPEAYYRAVTDAGATVILLPPQPIVDGSLGDVVARLDGLVISGGSDVNPARYGQQPRATTDHPRLDRDEWEFALAHAAFERGVPTLGICRGMQLINVAFGGTLHQHLPDVIGAANYSGAGEEFSPNEVVLSGGHVKDAYGPDRRIAVRSYHHQAADVVAAPLIVTARGLEGVVQAVEHPEHPYYVGVQWHPEQTPEDDRLFRSFVSAARAAAEPQLELAS